MSNASSSSSPPVHWRKPPSNPVPTEKEESSLSKHDSDKTEPDELPQKPHQQPRKAQTPLASQKLIQPTESDTSSVKIQHSSFVGTRKPFCLDCQKLPSRIKLVPMFMCCKDIKSMDHSDPSPAGHEAGRFGLHNKELLSHEIKPLTPSQKLVLTEDLPTGAPANHRKPVSTVQGKEKPPLISDSNYVKPLSSDVKPTTSASGTKLLLPGAQAEPDSKPTLPGEQQEPDAKHILSDEQPEVKPLKPITPIEKPIADGQSSLESATKLQALEASIHRKLHLDESILAPEKHPILPEAKPTLPVEKPILPLDKPILPVDKPILPVEKPHISSQQPSSSIIGNQNPTFTPNPLTQPQHCTNNICEEELLRYSKNKMLLLFDQLLGEGGSKYYYITS